MAETTLPATTFFQKVWRELILNVANGTGAVQGGCTVHQNRVCIDSYYSQHFVIS